MDHFLTDFQTNFYIGCLLLLSNIFIHLAKMMEETDQPIVADPPIAAQEAIVQHSEELEFDCPNSFNFKDPNVEDFNLNILFGRFASALFSVFSVPNSSVRTTSYLIRLSLSSRRRPSVRHRPSEVAARPNPDAHQTVRCYQNGHREEEANSIADLKKEANP